MDGGNAREGLQLREFAANYDLLKERGREKADLIGGQQKEKGQITIIISPEVDGTVFFILKLQVEIE